MSRSDQKGTAAPRQGTMIRQSRFGAANYMTPALERFPPPDFLTEMQQNLWIACLSDVPLDFFRSRHIPIMIQYVRCIERMMKYSDEVEADPDDAIAYTKWNGALNLSLRLEKHLSFGTGDLMMLVVRARTEMKLSNQQRNRDEASEGESPAQMRAGLTYVGH
jgi:hypothetical protein